MRMQSFHRSVQGASHIKQNKECQDASESYSDERCAIAVVCDGHGGDDYVRSASGSKFACTIAREKILKFIQNVNRDALKYNATEQIRDLQSKIIAAWNAAVYEHYNDHPFTEAEIAVLSAHAKYKYLHEKRVESAYGTTLIAAACTEDYWFGIHIGDGKCVVVYPDGQFCQPISWDEKCCLNETTSLCDDNAIERFRRYYSSEQLPVAVFISSDGIDGSFNTEQQFNDLYKSVLYSFATNDFDTARDELGDYLPRLSAQGSGDDMSVAAILDLDRIRELDVVKTYDPEEKKARIAENKRIAAQKAEEERRMAETARRQKLEAERQKLEAERLRIENEGRRIEAKRQKIEAERQKIEAERRTIEAKRRTIEAKRRPYEAKIELKTAAKWLSVEAKWMSVEAKWLSNKAEWLKNEAERQSNEAERQSNEAKRRKIEAAISEISQPRSTTVIHCSNCATELESKMKFCWNCGSHASIEETQKSAPAASPEIADAMTSEEKKVADEAALENQVSENVEKGGSETIIDGNNMGS